MFIKKHINAISKFTTCEIHNKHNFKYIHKQL